jgi:hypothetical protein
VLSIDQNCIVGPYLKILSRANFYTNRFMFDKCGCSSCTILVMQPGRWARRANCIPSQSQLYFSLTFSWCFDWQVILCWGRRAKTKRTKTRKRRRCRPRRTTTRRATTTTCAAPAVRVRRCSAASSAPATSRWTPP